MIHLLLTGLVFHITESVELCQVMPSEGLALSSTQYSVSKDHYSNKITQSHYSPNVCLAKLWDRNFLSLIVVIENDSTGG